MERLPHPLDVMIVLILIVGVLLLAAVFLYGSGLLPLR